MTTKMPNPPVSPRFATGSNISAQSAAVGTDWTAFAATQCAQLTIVNDTGTSIEWRQDGAGVALTVPDGQAYAIFGIDDASQIAVRRKDVSNTQVTVKARVEI